MLSLRNNTNFIEKDTYFSSIGEGLGIEKQKISLFLNGFNAYLQQQNRGDRTLANFIIQIRSYLKKQRGEIQRIFSGTIFSNYDCLTQCILAGVISESFGYKLNLARPTEIHRYYHVFLVDENKGKYKMAGKKKIEGYEILDTEETIQQLKITHPLISLGNKIKHSVKKLLGNKNNPS